MRNSHNIIKNSNLVHIKNTALQGDIIGFYMVCHENYPAGHWKEIQIWNHPFFLTFFLTRAPKYHISITMETGEDTYLILSVSTTTTSLTNLLNTSTGQNCCTVHFWKGLQIHYLWIWVSRSEHGDKKSIQWFLKSSYPRRVEHVLLLDCKTTLARLNFRAWVCTRCTKLLSDSLEKRFGLSFFLSNTSSCNLLQVSQLNSSNISTTSPTYLN